MANWRTMNSLLVLLEQVDEYAPNRSIKSDGQVGDVNHASTSGHYPHPVPGVGPKMVTALDLTHDPAGGFDSYAFAEGLRVNRDNRIRYVISKKRIFSSYPVGNVPAFVWREYTGSPDPHTGHVHVQVLDAIISDTKTRWNLEGLPGMALTEADIKNIVDGVWSRNVATAPSPSIAAYRALDEVLQTVRLLKSTVPTDLVTRLNAILAAALDDGNTTVVLPPDAIADLEQIKDMLDDVPTAQENADAVVEEIAS